MNNVKKILYVHRSAGKTYGGALIDLLRVLDRLDRSSFEPIVLLSMKNFHAELFKEICVRTILFPLPPFRKGKSLPIIPFVVYHLVRFLRQEGIDLVHVNDADDAAILILACRWVNIPCVVHVRSEMEPKKFKKLWVHRADYVFAVSDVIRKTAILGGVKAEKIKVMYSGIDIANSPVRMKIGQEVRKKYGFEGKTVIGNIANLSPIKRPVFFIETMKMVFQDYPDTVALWVGSDDYDMQNGLEKRVDEMGMGDRLIFCGFQQDILSYLAAMDIFVLSSYSEGLSISLLEAMAFKIPVISTCAGGVVDVIIHNETGFLVKKDNPIELADAINLLLSSPKLLKKIGESGYERVNSVFNLKKLIFEYQDMYKSLSST